MEAIEPFRAGLAAGRTQIGISISFTDPLVTAAVAESVDFLWIDLEHGAMSAEALNGHLLAAHARQRPALVRVTGSATPFIKPILDAGADGIIVPQVRTAEEVQRVVHDCRYPPLGHRGYGPRVPSRYGRDGGSDYVERANALVFVSVQIETREALDALDAILAISGLDSVVLGPWDLSAALGHMGDVEHPDVVAALDLVIARAHRAGKWVGSGMGVDPDYAIGMARRGVQWLQVGGDYGYMVTLVDRTAATLRAQLH